MTELERQLYEALKAVEWVWNGEWGLHECPECGNMKSDGHEPTCPLAAALRKAEGKGATDED